MSAMTTCPQCGATMRTHGRDGYPRTYCGNTCARVARNAARDAQGISATARAEDAEFLLQTGLGARETAQRLGLAIGSMGQIMRRAGRPDLARPFELEANRARRAAA